MTGMTQTAPPETPQALLDKGHAPFSRKRPPHEDDTGGGGREGSPESKAAGGGRGAMTGPKAVF